MITCTQARRFKISYGCVGPPAELPVVISGDVQKAFLQVRVRESERDALRFHWRCHADRVLETLRFTGVLFGLASSPFLRAGVIEQHLNSW